MPPFLLTPDELRQLNKYGLVRPSDGYPLPSPFPEVAKTANYTILPVGDLNGTVFSNRGAAGAITFTLPAVTAVPVGRFYLFVGVANFGITVQVPTAGTLIALNNAAATSLSASTAAQIIGALILVHTDGTNWFATGIGVGATYTVA